ncbi:hypothetical protein NEOLI_004308 [Neolecta irregularis DAH-3]|uniref:Uncharacterized protein n=1 Tax=Neolecta irregularis (strain DAH-3) TaxID=1198029 RepID=A0A1U7LPW2_NEOID|nr:hypothetical protein NEOLI_004308 [Neolecta irregularis DAH-3]|eukprot:OLL24623.1 hypothetical protein NEOLI_004308 [Neolecta irregularis DAH-3]
MEHTTCRVSPLVTGFPKRPRSLDLSNAKRNSLFLTRDTSLLTPPPSSLKVAAGFGTFQPLPMTPASATHLPYIEDDLQTETQTVESLLVDPFAEDLKDVPLAYVRSRLAELGPRFLMNAESASCYIRAVPSSTSFVVRVVPSSGAAPFFISSSHKTEESSSQCSSPLLPIHVEYASLNTPILHSLLLSGHVKRGDILEIPLPYPEMWIAAVGWIYTRRFAPWPNMEEDEVYEKVMEIVQFLGFME